MLALTGLRELLDKLQFVLYYYKTYPTFDVLGQQFDMARSKANENGCDRSIPNPLCH